jgi:hypothetical protein
MLVLALPGCGKAPEPEAAKKIEPPKKAAAEQPAPASGKASSDAPGPVEPAPARSPSVEYDQKK